MAEVTIPFREDATIYPVMVDLVGMVVSELEQSGLPGVAFAGVVPGDRPNIDVGQDDECGAVWVRLENAFPSGTAFPAVDQTVSSCATSIAFTLEVGVARCSKVFKDAGGEAPEMEDQLAEARLQMADMAAMRRAITCRLAKPSAHFPMGVTLVLGNYTPMPTSGGAAGSLWEVTVLAPRNYVPDSAGAQ